MPTGSPSRVRPMGAVVAGRPVRVAKEIQKSRSRYWREPSGVVNRRSKILGLWSCGKAATKAVGKRKASWVRKYSCQTARAALRRLTAAEKCLNGAVHARACLAAYEPSWFSAGRRERPAERARVLLVGTAEHLERRAQIGGGPRQRSRDG